MKEESRPNYRIRVTVLTPTCEVEGVLCELRLPARIRDDVDVRLLPIDNKQFYEIHRDWKFGIRYETDDIRIIAETVYVEHAGSTRWASDVQDHEIRARAADLTISSKWESRSRRAIFHLTPNVFLRPSKALEWSGTGEVRVETVERVAFPCFREAGWISFDSQYRHQRVGDGMLTFPELVGECELPDDSNAERVVVDLDEFLLLVSYATRQRVVCLGWSSATQDAHTLHFRRSVVLPREAPDHSFNDTLIHQENFIEFLRIGYSTLRDHPQKDLLRQVLHQATFYRDSESSRTVTVGYLTLYATLESLAQLFVGLKPEVGLNLADRDQWRALRKGLHRVVEQSSLPTEKRSGVYKSIGGLNRAPFGDVLRALSDFFSVDLSDLWPVTDDKEGITLAQIRNKLVHGYFLGSEFERRLVIAEAHLEAIVDRLLLAVLGWNSRESRVAVWSLNWLNAHKREQWERVRTELTRMT